MSILNSKFKKYCLFNEEKELDTCTLTILLTNKCTLSCWYCSCHSKTKKVSPMKENFITKDDFEKILDFIELQNRKTIKMIFTGGEPTLHPNLSDFMVKAEERFGDKLSIQLNTNLSNSMKVYDKLPEFSIEVNASFHSDFVRDREKWFEKALSLNEDNLVRVNLMLEKHNNRLMKELYNKYSDRLNISVRPIFEFRDTEECEAHRWFKKDHESHQDLSKEEVDGIQVEPKEDGWEKWRNFYGMVCSAEFIVMQNGECWYCWQEVWKKKPLLNIFKDEPIKINRFHLCTSKVCNDGFYFPKYSIEYYNKNIKER